ncbi:MAG: hypothetical protein ACYCO9_11890 [Streptosporangiaceae bacterium]
MTRWRPRAAADALGLLALVAGQDAEPAADSDGTGGRWRIARKVAPGRVISAVGREARHTRKCKPKRRDGFRGHVAAEPESGLITDCEMTMAAGEGGSDAENGVTMAGRDRFWPAPGAQPAADTGPEAQAGTAQDAARQGTPDRAQPDTARTGEGLEIYGDSASGSGQARAGRGGVRRGSGRRDLLRHPGADLRAGRRRHELSRLPGGLRPTRGHDHAEPRTCRGRADELYVDLVPESVYGGAVDYDALLRGDPQPALSERPGGYALSRVGDAVASRNAHAAILDSLRLCATL